MARYEFVEGGSSKFWEANVTGSTLKVRWGRIGSEGQSKDQKLGSAAEAKAALEKLTAEKEKKGYRLAGAAPKRAAPASARPPAPKLLSERARKAAHTLAAEGVAAQQNHRWDEALKTLGKAAKALRQTDEPALQAVEQALIAVHRLSNDEAASKALCQATVARWATRWPGDVSISVPEVGSFGVTLRASWAALGQELANHAVKGQALEQAKEGWARAAGGGAAEPGAKAHREPKRGDRRGVREALRGRPRRSAGGGRASAKKRQPARSARGGRTASVRDGGAGRSRGDGERVGSGGRALGEEENAAGL